MEYNYYRIKYPGIWRSLPGHGKDVSNIPIQNPSLFRKYLPFFNYKFLPKDRRKLAPHVPSETNDLILEVTVCYKNNKQVEHSAHPHPLGSNSIDPSPGLWTCALGPFPWTSRPPALWARSNRLLKKLHTL